MANKKQTLSPEDWLGKLRPQEHIVLNEEKAERLEKVMKCTWTEVCSKFKENHMDIPAWGKLVLLDGWRFLANEYGVKATELTPAGVYPDYASYISRIEWKDGLVSSEVGECFATQEVYPFNFYPSSLAGNRAYARNVRVFLGIQSYGKDEMLTKKSGNTKNTASAQERQQVSASTGQDKSKSVVARLIKLAEEKSVSFEKIQKKAIASKMSGAGTWEKFEDIPSGLAATMVAGLQKM